MRLLASSAAHGQGCLLSDVRPAVAAPRARRKDATEVAGKPWTTTAADDAC
jgi:hypothetical protein